MREALYFMKIDLQNLINPASNPAVISGWGQIWPDLKKWPGPDMTSGATLVLLLCSWNC